MTLGQLVTFQSQVNIRVIDLTLDSNLGSYKWMLLVSSHDKQKAFVLL